MQKPFLLFLGSNISSLIYALKPTYKAVITTQTRPNNLLPLLDLVCKIRVYPKLSIRVVHFDAIFYQVSSVRLSIAPRQVADADGIIVSRDHCCIRSVDIGKGGCY